MASIFISHSSLDFKKATAVKDWLADNGWSDVFLDVDPERGLVAGQRWKDELQRAARSCKLVLALVSNAWLGSAWCRSEVNAARLMGKKVLVAIVDDQPVDIPADLADEQWIDLIRDPMAYERLKAGLHAAGLDATTFILESGRQPYPGLAALSEEDAAIFFGRDAHLVRAMDRLRTMSRVGVDRLLVVLGASGAGKSSFLRAGLIPRLRRDEQRWVVAPLIRPERAPVSGEAGMARAIFHLSRDALGDAAPVSLAALEEQLWQGPDALQRLLNRIQLALPAEEGRKRTLILPIDQSEELFTQASPESTQFQELLASALTGCENIISIFALRSDALPELQASRALKPVDKDTFVLDPMTHASYRAVIEGPAKIARPAIDLDPELTEALLSDTEGQDALPLLAFTLRELYDRHLENGRLSLAAYHRSSGLRGVLETAVERAVAQAADHNEVPTDLVRREQVLRSIFIPALATLNGAGRFVRRMASMSEFPGEAVPLIQRLVDARVLVRDRRVMGNSDDDVIEVAHEALLREWSPLKNWLEQERGFMSWRYQVGIRCQTYLQLPEGKRQNGLLEGFGLEEAKRWLKTHRSQMSPDLLEFIHRSILLARQKRTLALLPIGSMIVAALIIVPFSSTLIPLADQLVFRYRDLLPWANYSTLLVISAGVILGSVMAGVFALAWIVTRIFLRA